MSDIPGRYRNTPRFQRCRVDHHRIGTGVRGGQISDKFQLIGRIYTRAVPEILAHQRNRLQDTIGKFHHQIAVAQCRSIDLLRSRIGDREIVCGGKCASLRLAGID